MKLYKRERVKKIEAAEEFKAAKEQSVQRKLSAQKATKTKLDKMRVYLDKLTIEVPVMEKEALITASRQHFYTLDILRA